jgi:hypothetical protein
MLVLPQSGQVLASRMFSSPVVILNGTGVFPAPVAGKVQRLVGTVFFECSRAVG